MTEPGGGKGYRTVDHSNAIEVSGGIHLDDVADYADAGADLISAGAITNSAPNLDIGLDLETDESRAADD